MRLHVAAPASTANLGSGFDCAALALDLWNELEVETAPDGPRVEIEGEGAGELAVDASNLVLRAFALAADPAPFRFRLLNRIPLERGLGSSSAAIAAGYAAGCAVAGIPCPVGWLPLEVAALEGHADNLAAAFNGGACLTWRDGGEVRVRRIADRAPLEAVAVIPATRGKTSAMRSRLPATVEHAVAAVAAGRGALLGAALASGDPELFAQSLGDVLHEPYRAAEAPLFAELKQAPPDGVLGVTLSGSGPTAIAWAEPADAARVGRALSERYGEATISVLAAVATGVLAREVIST